DIGFEQRRHSRFDALGQTPRDQYLGFAGCHADQVRGDGRDWARPSATIKDVAVVISQFRTPCKAMLFKPAFAGSARAVFSVLIMLILFAWMPAAPALAQAATASGLKLPRFVSTRSDPINVRVGPGTKYAIAWNFVVSGVPVEIIQEFDTWRKI